MNSPRRSHLSLQMGPWVVPWPVSSTPSLSVGFLLLFLALWTVAIFLVQWGILSIALGHSNQRCRAHSHGGSNSTYSSTFCLGHPFNLSSHAKVGSSLIYTRTWSSEVLSRVKLAIRPSKGHDLRSSFLLPVRVSFLPPIWMGIVMLFSLLRSNPLAVTVSSAFIYFMALYSMLAMVFGSFL